MGVEPITFLFNKHSEVSNFLSNHITGLVSKVCTNPEELFDNIQQHLKEKKIFHRRPHSAQRTMLI